MHMEAPDGVKHSENHFLESTSFFGREKMKKRAFLFLVASPVLLAAAVLLAAVCIIWQDWSGRHHKTLEYLFIGDYDKVIADLTQAIRLNPNNVFAYQWRGSAYYDKRDYDRAIADYTQAIRLNPNNDRAYKYRSLAYADKGDYDNAIADLTYAILFDSDDVWWLSRYYYKRGKAYADKGDYDMAIADYEVALRLEPNSILAEFWLEKARQARGW